ncbi:hypothetical protein LSH36_581g03053 [Paralvinella palmiformis]|uniref:PAW domain-containing protein n=1 Tax=Paralvinella palmiformis TaxID=53620 RepID=A0AAD9MWN5_9ANNE|nr:hypothetical protein LSH36_581g03053 [Paralvinella palmiformis]
MPRRFTYNIVVPVTPTPVGMVALLLAGRISFMKLKTFSEKKGNDWKMVYLARCEGTDTATITWKIDLQGTGLVADRMDIQALSTCYENGCIWWRICADEQCAVLPSDGRLTSVDNVSGSSVITISATLSQGQGNVSWQHTQLFRQSAQDVSNPFDVQIFLKSVKN